MPEVPVPVDARDQETGSIHDLLKPDPTANVRALIALEVKRLDDIISAEHVHSEEMRKAQTLRLDDMATLRAFYDDKLRDAEAKRIDAIRAVDVNAVAVANDRANAQAQVLATQVAASAEALRSLVATTSATVAQQFNQVTTQMIERVAALEKSSYEGQGKATYTDPAMTQLTALVAQLAATSDRRSGTGAGSAATVAYLFGSIGAIGGVIGIVIALTR